MYQEETLICEDCGKEFVFTVGEQEFYAEKGLTNKPKRCQECRKIKKQQFIEIKLKFCYDKSRTQKYCIWSAVFIDMNKLRKYMEGVN